MALAIVGMSTRFPQDATSNENLWDFLLAGRSAHTAFPPHRINAAGHYHPDPEHGGTVSFPQPRQMVSLLIRWSLR